MIAKHNILQVNPTDITEEDQRELSNLVASTDSANDAPTKVGAKCFVILPVFVIFSQTRHVCASQRRKGTHK